MPSLGHRIPAGTAPAEVPDPVPGQGEVLVDIAAAGVNRADLLQRQGAYPPPPGAPDYPGLECSGRVSAVGPGVTGWQPGDEVCALLAGGGYAERVAVPAGQLLPVPGGVDLTGAAALPEAACTVHSNVVTRAGLARGETLLVHGGASGIGRATVELFVAEGAKVVVNDPGTSGSGEGSDTTPAQQIVDEINEHVRSEKVAKGDVPRELSEQELAEIKAFGQVE